MQIAAQSEAAAGGSPKETPEKGRTKMCIGGSLWMTDDVWISSPLGLVLPEVLSFPPASQTNASSGAISVFQYGAVCERDFFSTS